MTDENIQELICIVDSCSNNLKAKWQHKLDNAVDRRCREFCALHDIRITHGSAYKELQNKAWYYKDKCIKSIINYGIDLYLLRENHIISDKMIVDRLFKIGGTKHE